MRLIAKPEIFWNTRRTNNRKLRRVTRLSQQVYCFLVVATEQESIIAADYVGAGRGDRVLLITGSAASKYCMEAPVDAAVVAIMDGKEE